MTGSEMLTPTEEVIIASYVVQIGMLIISGLGVIAVRQRFLDRHLWISLCALLILFILRRFDDISELLNRPLLDNSMTTLFSMGVVMLFSFSIFQVYRAERRRRRIQKACEPRIDYLEELRRQGSPGQW